MLKHLLNGISHFCMSPEEPGGAGAGASTTTGTEGAAATTTTTGTEGTGTTGTTTTTGTEGTATTGTTTGTEGTTTATEGTEAPDWRAAIAGEDVKAMETLNRFASPKELFKSYNELRAKVASGEVKAQLPKDATPEQTAAWRKSNGIPETAEAYFDKLPENVKLEPADKAMLAPFVKDLFDANAPPSVVHASMSAFKKAQASAAQQIQEADSAIVAANEDALRKEWQGDYRGNMAAADAFLTTHFSAEAKAALLSARDGQGKPLAHNTDFLRAAAQLGRTLAPAGATHGQGMDSIDTIETELAGLKARMGSKEWFKDEKAQERYRTLVTARDNMKKRA